MIPYWPKKREVKNNTRMPEAVDLIFLFYRSIRNLFKLLESQRSFLAFPKLCFSITVLIKIHAPMY